MTMVAPGWPDEESPFHEGELAVQARMGVREKLDISGRRGIRATMPEQHRTFFAQLPFLIAGTVDQESQPWASVLAAPPGFVHSPDPRRLDVDASALFADPLHRTLAPGAPIGLLGIEPHTRRRNRMNGHVRSVAAGGFSVEVSQSFGNCPKYIQAREAYFVDTEEREKSGHAVHRALVLTPEMCSLISAADTLFLATAYDRRDAADDLPQHGVDVSHRGGKPGFVRIDDMRTLTLPDFVGNFFFNTIGNLLLNPRAGLLFIDFANGNLLYVAADAEVIWDGAEVQAFQGAQRLLRFTIRSAMLVEASLPLRWSAAELSPFLEKTGEWHP